MSRPQVEIRTSRGEARSPVALAVFLIAYLAILGFLVLPRGALLVHPVVTAEQTGPGR